jgi:hypothetical protein
MKDLSMSLVVSTQGIMIPLLILSLLNLVVAVLLKNIDVQKMVPL